MDQLLSVTLGGAVLHGATISILLIIGIPLLIVVGAIWYVSRM